MKNNGTWKFVLTAIATAIASASILTGIALAYGRLNQKVDEHGKKIERLESYAEDVIRLKQDIKYIKEAVDRIEKKNE